MRWLLLAALACLVWYALHSGAIVIADRWKPWTPLRIADEPNVLTRWKLMRATGDDGLCQAVLAGAEMSYTRLPDRQTGPGCGFRNAVRITRTTAMVGDAFSLSCRAALSLAMWERHVLQPEAQRVFGQSVTGIEHFGSYACRNIYSREGASRSRHATADALDVAGFTLGDGRRIRIVRDWGPPERRDRPATGSAGGNAADIRDAAYFLRSLHRGACRYFDSALGPDYNAAHADHFHLDRGGYRACR